MDEQAIREKISEEFSRQLKEREYTYNLMNVIQGMIKQIRSEISTGNGRFTDNLSIGRIRKAFEDEDGNEIEIEGTQFSFTFRAPQYLQQNFDLIDFLEGTQGQDMLDRAVFQEPLEIRLIFVNSPRFGISGSYTTDPNAVEIFVDESEFIDALWMLVANIDNIDDKWARKAGQFIHDMIEDGRIKNYETFYDVTRRWADLSDDIMSRDKGRDKFLLYAGRLYFYNYILESKRGYKVFAHELRHYMDFFWKLGKKKAGEIPDARFDSDETKEDYLNNPFEKHAFLSEMLQVMKLHYDDLSDESLKRIMNSTEEMNQKLDNDIGRMLIYARQKIWGHDPPDRLVKWMKKELYRGGKNILKNLWQERVVDDN